MMYFIYQAESSPTSAEEYGAIILQKYARGFLARKRYVKLLLDQFEKVRRCSAPSMGLRVLKPPNRATKNEVFVCSLFIPYVRLDIINKCRRHRYNCDIISDGSLCLIIIATYPVLSYYWLGCGRLLVNKLLL